MYSREKKYNDNSIDGQNFFLMPTEQDSVKYSQEPTRRLNDYDMNILQEDAYKDVKDEVFKLEYRISRLEGQINDIDKQIQAAREIKDYVLLETLFSRKKFLQDDLDSLLAIYSDSSLSAKISGEIFNFIPKSIKDKFSLCNKLLISVSELFLSKLPKRFSSGLEIRKSLAKLENISKNVDELMTLQTPYGEAQDKYEQLSKYIIKANNIQAQISKYLR